MNVSKGLSSDPIQLRVRLGHWCCTILDNSVAVTKLFSVSFPEPIDLRQNCFTFRFLSYGTDSLCTNQHRIASTNSPT